MGLGERVEAEPEEVRADEVVEKRVAGRVGSCVELGGPSGGEEGTING